MRKAVAPGLVCLLAAANFLWQLGSPSLFVDEALSWGPALAPLRDVIDGVRAIEISPPGHYLFLHEWMVRVESDEEWVLRLPSALAGVALVLVTYRLGAITLGRRPALIASGLIALSPFALTYAQQARSYVFAMLLCALAALAVVELLRAPTRRRRRLLLAAYAVLAIAAVYTHYTAALALMPLHLWLLREGGLGRPAGAGLSALVVVSCLPLVPLLSDQLSKGHQEGIAKSARLELENGLKVFGALFEGRAGELTPFLLTGVVCLAVAAGVLWRRRERAPGPARWFALVALVPPLASLVATAVADDVLISRYSAVAVPFAALAFGAALELAPRALAGGLAVLALLAALGGSLDLHRSERFYPDVRQAFERIAAGYRPGDAINATGYPGIGWIGEYYRRRSVPQAPPVILPGQNEELFGAIDRRARIWTVAEGPFSRPLVDEVLKPLGYRVAGGGEVGDTLGELSLYLAAPRRPRVP